MDNPVYIIPLPNLDKAGIGKLWQRLCYIWPCMLGKDNFYGVVSSILDKDEEDYVKALRVEPGNHDVWGVSRTSFYLSGEWCGRYRIIKLELEDLESYNDN